MPNLTAGIPPQLYGAGGRRVSLPIQALAQVWEGGFAAEIAGACVAGTTAGAGDCIGVFEHDALGGATDGAKRVSVLTDRIVLMAAGVAAPTDATPYGALLFMETDNTVGTGGVGATQRIAGRFVGIEDDGRVRVFIGETGTGVASEPVIGTALTDVATTTIQRVGRVSRYSLAGAMSQDDTITLGTTGAVYGDVIRVIRTSTSAHTLSFVNGGAGAGTLAVLVASKIGWFQAWFDGANWQYDGSSAT